MTDGLFLRFRCNNRGVPICTSYAQNYRGRIVYRSGDTPIGNAPRITIEYYFEAHRGDGYAPSNSIFFKGATGAAPLRTYLEKLGYTKEKRRLGEKEIWSKPDQVNGDLFYLYFNAAMGEVELTKVMNY